MGLLDGRLHYETSVGGVSKSATKLERKFEYAYIHTYI